MEDLIIIGSGCAGLSAGIYAARAGMKPLILEGMQPGGLITTTTQVENFPAYPEGISGFELVWKMREQAQKFGARIENLVVEKVDFNDDVKKIYCQGDNVLECKKVIIATGSSPRLTGVVGEKEMYAGKGVSACATCDGAFFRGEDMVVVGGGDSACEEAIFLTRFANSVKIIHRRDEFRASKIMAQRVLSNEKITPVWDSVLEAILPDEDGKCKAIVVKNLKTNQLEEISCRAVFIAIGHTPNTSAFQGQLDMDSQGYITVEKNVKTNIENVYAAGDCADKDFKQAITASAMGCMAAIMASNK